MESVLSLVGINIFIMAIVTKFIIIIILHIFTSSKLTIENKEEGVNLFKVVIKTPEQCHWRRLIIVLLILSRFHNLFRVLFLQENNQQLHAGVYLWLLIWRKIQFSYSEKDSNIQRNFEIHGLFYIRLFYIIFKGIFKSRAIFYIKKDFYSQKLFYI